MLGVKHPDPKHHNTRYPRDNWLHVYTEGSAQEDCITHAGFYCAGFFEGSSAVVLNNTNFKAEIEADFLLFN